MTEARRATLTIIFPPKVKGGDEGYWYLYIRRPRPAEDEQIPAKQWHLRSDRPAVEAFAAPYRKALAKGLSEPQPETCDEWFKRYHTHQKASGLSDADKKKTRWDKWISPRIGKKSIVHVTRADIEDVRDALDDAIRAWAPGKAAKNGTVVSGKTAMNIWTALTSSFKEATSGKRRDLRVLEGKANPCAGVQPPGRSALSQSKAQDVPLSERGGRAAGVQGRSGAEGVARGLRHRALHVRPARRASRAALVGRRLGRRPDPHREGMG